jgi:hypothetical protein
MGTGGAAPPHLTFSLPCLASVCSAVFNGSFGVFTKLPKARIVPPLVMTYWLAEGVVLSSAILLAFPPRVSRSRPGAALAYA